MLIRWVGLDLVCKVLGQQKWPTAISVATSAFGKREDTKFLLGGVTCTIYTPSINKQIYKQIKISNCVRCHHQWHAGSKTLHQQNSPCRLTQADLYNGCKTVVVVIISKCTNVWYTKRQTDRHSDLEEFIEVITKTLYKAGIRKLRKNQIFDLLWKWLFRHRQPCPVVWIFTHNCYITTINMNATTNNWSK